MEYTCAVVIDLPRQRVIELFDSSGNLKKWQNGLESFKVVSGEPGQAGAQMELIYEINGRRVEMLETILKRDFPDELSATYEAKGVKNWVYNRFIENEDGSTRWEMDTEFKFSGMMRLMGIFMRGAFPKQTLADMNRFKDFAESE